MKTQRLFPLPFPLLFLLSSSFLEFYYYNLLQTVSKNSSRLNNEISYRSISYSWSTAIRFPLVKGLALGFIFISIVISLSHHLGNLWKGNLLLRPSRSYCYFPSILFFSFLIACNFMIITILPSGALSL